MKKNITKWNWYWTINCIEKDYNILSNDWIDQILKINEYMSMMFKLTIWSRIFINNTFTNLAKTHRTRRKDESYIYDQSINKKYHCINVKSIITTQKINYFSKIKWRSCISRIFRLIKMRSEFAIFFIKNNFFSWIHIVFLSVSLTFSQSFRSRSQTVRKNCKIVRFFMNVFVDISSTRKTTNVWQLINDDTKTNRDLRKLNKKS
jgi:hypothetical protein